jgi:hypothetical protein
MVGLASASGAQAAPGNQQTGGWKNCGLFHEAANRYIRTEAKEVGCKEALRVGRKVIVGYDPSFCPRSTCEVAGFKCPLYQPGRKRILCTRAEDAARIRLKGVTKR